MVKQKQKSKKRIDLVQCKYCSRFKKIPNYPKYICGYSGARMTKKDGDRYVQCSFYEDDGTRIMLRKGLKNRQQTGIEYVVNVTPSGGFGDVSVYKTYDHIDRVHEGNISHDEYRNKVLMRKIKRRGEYEPPEVKYINGNMYELLDRGMGRITREEAQKYAQEWRDSAPDCYARIFKDRFGNYWVYGY